MLSLLQPIPKVDACPVCGAKNVSVGHVYGHRARGKKKKFTPEHKKWLSEHMKKVQKDRTEACHRRKVLGVNTEAK